MPLCLEATICLTCNQTGRFRILACSVESFGLASENGFLVLNDEATMYCRCTQVFIQGIVD